MEWNEVKDERVLSSYWLWNSSRLKCLISNKIIHKRISWVEYSKSRENEAQTIAHYKVGILITI